jgi:hypothetical protein
VQILPDARGVAYRLDAQRAQLVRRADAGEQQDLR